MVHGASQNVSRFYCPSCASVMLRVCVCGCVAKSPTHVDGVVGVADVADVANAHCQQKTIALVSNLPMMRAPGDGELKS